MAGEPAGGPLPERLLAANDFAALRRALRSSSLKGTFPDEDLSASDLIIPPSDLTLEETRKLFSDEGLIPDLPVR